MIFEFGDRDVRPNGPGFVAGLYFVERRERLNINEDFGLGDVFLHFAQKVHAAGEVTAIGAEQLVGAGGRSCGDVLKGIHTDR